MSTGVISEGPARFSAAYLNISPEQVLPDQQVEISINIANHGGETGSHSVVLYINGNVEKSSIVGVSPGATQRVVFTVSRTLPGTYKVSVEGQEGQFTVVAGEAAAQPGIFGIFGTGGLGTGGIIAIIVVVIVLALGLVFGLRRE
jgi:hypothetical protein